MKKSKTFFGIPILMFIVVLLLSACDGAEEFQNIEENQRSSKKVVYSNELFIPVTQFETLNPLLNKNKSVYQLNMLLFEGLTKLDENQQAKPALAAAWQTSEDGKIWTFTLRDNAQWHDGKPFTAEDVKFTIDTFRFAKSINKESIYNIYTDRIKEVKVQQGKVVVIELDSGVNAFPELFTFPILPKHKFKSVQDVLSAVNMIPIGTGVYKIEEYSRSKYIKLVSHLGYWGTQPAIKSVIAQIVPDKVTALSSLEANEVSVAESNNFDWEKYNEDETLRIYEYVTQEYEFLGFNLSKELLQNKSIRQAIAYGIDRQAIANDVFLGHTTISDVPIYPDSWLYDESEKRYGHDINKAKKMLNDNFGEIKYPNQYFESDSGQKLSFHLLVNENNSQRLRTAELIKSQLKDVGIEIIIEKVNWEEYLRRTNSRSFDIILGGWKLGNVPDLSFAFHSAANGTGNLAGYKDEEMDKLLNMAGMIKNEEQKKQTYKALQQKIVEDIPYFGMYFKNNSIIVKDSVDGDINPKSFNLFNGIENWKLVTPEE